MISIFHICFCNLYLIITIRHNLFEFLLTPVIFFDLNDVGRTLDSQKYDAGRALFKERTQVLSIIRSFSSDYSSPTDIKILYSNWWNFTTLALLHVVYICPQHTFTRPLAALVAGSFGCLVIEIMISPLNPSCVLI